MNATAGAPAEHSGGWDHAPGKETHVRLNGFLLRHGRTYAGRGRWTQAHWRWLETQRFDARPQQIVLEEYVEAVRAAQTRI